MRVAVITTSWGPPWNEGVRNLARSLTDYLEAAGDSVEVLHPSPSAVAAGGWRGPWRQARFLMAAPRRLRAGRFDAALWFTSLSPWFGSKLLILRTAGVPVLPYVTGLRAAGPVIAPRAPGPVLVITPHFQRRYFPRAVWVPPFLPATVRRPADFARTPPAPGETRRVLFLGAFEAGRGVETLLEGLARVEGPYELTLAWNGVGAAREPSIRSLVSALGLAARVRLLRDVDVGEECRRAHVLVIPRRTATRMAFPVRILEAAHMRLPMIVSDILGMPEIVGEAGLSFAPGDPISLAAALTSLLGDPDRYRRAVAGCADLESRCSSSGSLARVREELCHVAARG
ncbi:MAG: glycosyltransferase family 4 protein [Candidatus Krumholzibacteriia bacterium]